MPADHGRGPETSGSILAGRSLDGVMTSFDEEDSLSGRQVALIDLLDRLLSGGAVLTGDLVLSVADIDLVHINLRAVIRSLGPESEGPW